MWSRPTTELLGRTLTAHSADAGTWQPVLLDPAKPDDELRLAELVERGAVSAFCDTIQLQLRDLVAVRNPTRKLSGTELEERVAAHLSGMPAEAHGVYWFYPWSGRLVHLLPELEYRELRCSANRNRITRKEQERLRRLRIGVVGLSVGHSTALTLAQEEVGGEYRLADFDTLEPSNLNRLRAGVHELGLSKAVITARAIYEINPYAWVTLFRDGITEHNIDDFLGADSALDLVFEECDSLEIKILVRERARKKRIPVVMETSDRGMLDVERFDLEPDRPLLHGLIGEIRAEDVRGLSNYEKVPIIIRMAGAENVSKRMAASMIDIETTLKTWPQLGSAVALSGAITTDAARRIALGTFTQSGRFYVDLERLLSDEVDGSVGPPMLTDVPSGAPVEPPPALPPVQDRLDESAVSVIVAYATLAPSGGNCQPWRFRWQDPWLWVDFDVTRSDTLLDFEGQASYLALGAAIENAVWVGRALGFEPRVELVPGSDPRGVARIQFSERQLRAEEARAMVETIALRATNRRLGQRVPLPDGVRESLRAIAGAFDAELDVVEGSAAMGQLGAILAEGDRFRFYSERLHRELMGELRWTSEDALRTRDGIDVATLELTPTDYAGMRLVSRRSLIDEVVKVEGGHGLGKATLKAVAASSALCRLSVGGRDRVSQLRGGRALQRVWLEAARRGLAFQPLTALLYLFARLEHGRGEGFREDERVWLGQLRSRYLDLLPVAPGTSEMMLFRLASAGSPTARSLRRPVLDVLTIES